MSNLRHRLKKLEPKPFTPVQVTWRILGADGQIAQQGQGTFSDLDRVIFGDHNAIDNRGEDEPEQSTT